MHWYIYIAHIKPDFRKKKLSVLSVAKLRLGHNGLL